ncbi:MAG: DUF3500 domain-containing protein [Pirellulaceae bacterium]|nr:DUF3500 domain-containing protein [Pirellulaceae bacterium]
MSQNPIIPTQAVSCDICQADRPSPSRRKFLAASAATASLLASSPSMVFGGTTAEQSAESTIAELYKSLSSDQRNVVAREWTDPLRKKVNANWHVTKPLIGGDFYTSTQKSMVESIVKQLTSESGYERLKLQTEDDDGGIEAYSMALFGKPGDEKFEWMLTGRHLTLRADGNCQDKIVFGGPVVYGHGEESTPKANIFYYQTEKVQSVYESLTADQRKLALVSSAPPAEANVPTQGPQGKFLGLQISSLQQEQKTLFQSALTSILSMYRDEDTSEATSILEQSGGVDNLRIAYFSKNDLLDDGIWDIWRIEGPSAVIHFRGAPHVHAYIHIGIPKAS